MRLVALLDTSIATDNLGDEIIMDAVRLELASILPDAYLITVPTHDTLGRRAHKVLKAAEFGVVGGTNIMSSRLIRGANWKLNPLDLGSMHDIVLMGVGWMDYAPQPTRFARYLYDRVLARKYQHSARDDYSRLKVSQLRSKVLNTACPTMWRPTPEHVSGIPSEKADEVITALTYYRPKPDEDRALLTLLSRTYDKIWLWVQQPEDLAYAQSLGDFAFSTIPPNVAAYSQLLASERIDFVGSRLHGGIRALQHGRRTLILAIDNRAREIGRDTGLPVIERDDLAGIESWIDSMSVTSVKLPIDAIDNWREQFSV